MTRSVQDGVSAVRGLEVGAADLDGLALRLLLLAGVHDVGEEPAFSVLVLGLLLVLLDGALIDAATQVQDLAARRRLPGVDVADEDHVVVRARVRLLQVLVDHRALLDRHLILLLLFLLGLLRLRGRRRRLLLRLLLRLLRSGGRGLRGSLLLLLLLPVVRSLLLGGRRGLRGLRLLRLRLGGGLRGRLRLRRLRRLPRGLRSLEVI
mmetsp:Transcript_17178/g.51446  ORF Transcript_17178/g.51446 Transcript_17178/m.51446 type:complete len:207 (-) Transcript_17178:607-1227(-)